MRKNLTVNRKSIWAIVIVILVAICFIAGNLAYIDAPAVNKPDSNPVIVSSQELLLFDSDRQISQDQTVSRIKAEYLKEVGGYRANDEVVAIINLDGKAVIDDYLDGANVDPSMTVGEYALGKAGKNASRKISVKQTALIKKLNAAGLIQEVGYRYTTIANAVSATVRYGDIAAIEAFDGVDSVILSDTYNLPKTTSTGDGEAINTVVNDVDVYEDTGIFNSSSVSSLGITGKGTAVAVLDSGFDCSHEVFSRQPDDSVPLWIDRDDVTAAVADPALKAAQTTSGLKMTDVWYSNKIPFMYDYGDKDFDVFPYDSEHGTHVAGIIGGSSDTITGVAVDTQLVLMKVFSDYKSGAETADILAALEDSVLLGVDCINMSLGTSCGFAREEDGSYENSVYDKINDSGISLITAASNSYSASHGGEQGDTNFVWNPDAGTVGSPSTYDAALSVASISGVKSSYLYANDADVIFFTESSSITGKRNSFIEELYAQQKLDDNETKVYEYVTVPGYGRRDNYLDVDASGKIALVRRGETSFEDKALRAKNAGAVACIIYNNIEGSISMSMGKTDHIPTISITKEMGELLASKPSGTIAVSKKYTAGPFMSDFSSWGPTPGLGIKPEITAHGGEIKSSIPGGGYDSLSGTSMASPNLCGVVVLIRQYLKDRFPDYSQQQIVVLANQMLMSTATIVIDENGNPYSPRKQGAGLASLSNVVNTKAYLSVDGKDRTKLELLDDPQKTGKYKMDFNVVNISESAVEYDLSVVGMTETVSSSDKDHVAEKDRLLGGSFNTKIEGDGTLKNNRIKVNAGATVKVSIDYSISSADKKSIDSQFPNGMYVEGFVKLTAVGDDIDLNVPFLAFYGDWTRAPIFDRTYYEVESEAHDGSIDYEDKIKADYYATTPYGSYFYNYVIPLGSYLYNVPDGYDEIPATQDHISVSDLNTSIDGFYAVYAGLLRNCKTMQYTIVDKLTGEIVHEYIDTNALKSFSDGASPMPSFEKLEWKSADLGLINNREYEFKMIGLLDYGDGGLTTNLNNTFKFDFTFDNEAPVIKSAVYEKEYDRTARKDRYYLTLTVYDNHYVQSITPIIFSTEGEYTMLTKEPIPVLGEKGAESKVRFEITDILDDNFYDAFFTSSLGFTIDDYALNTNLYLCQLPGTDGTLKFTTNGEPDATLKGAVSVYVDEVVDLTQYLSTTDVNVDENKDYLKYLTWTSGNSDVAQVQLGQVRGMTAGRTTVTVTDSMFGASATISINVRAREDAQSDETALGSVEAKNGGVQTSSTNDVADVTQENIESLRFAYFDTVFAYSRAGQSSMIGDTGSRKFISSLKGDLELYPGEQIKLAYEIQPWYIADRYKATYESSNPSIATVDQDGNVVAKQKGSVNITMKLDGSTRTASLSIKVNSEFVIENRMLVAYKGLGGDVVIPDDEGLLYIGPYAFCLYETLDDVKITEDDYDINKAPGGNSTVTSVVIPAGVEEIQKYAFYNCTALEKVEILGTDIKYVRDFAFAGDVNLKEINLENVYGIGRYAFRGCSSLDDIKLTKNYAIGEHGFENCTSLSSLDLTALRNTGESAFAGCTSLESVVLTENTKLAVRMFAGSGLEEAEISERVEIPVECFADCDKLTAVTLKNDLVAVGESAFAGCTALETFVFEGAALRIDYGAFAGCTSLKTFTFPNSDVTLGGDVFAGCEKLSEIKLGENTAIVNITASMFDGTDLSTITLDDGNTKYLVSADKSLLVAKSAGSNDFDTIVFATVRLLTNTYQVNGAYKYIAAGAFGGAEITKLVITNPETVIGDYAFAACAKLESVELPAADGAKRVTIGNNAFAGCEKLKTVSNLDSVLNVGDYAFTETGLEEVTIAADAEYGEGVFFLSALETATVGEGAKFGLGAFQSCESLTTVNMPQNGGVHFGRACFLGDTALVDIDLSKHDGEIESYAFYGCTKLAEAKLTEVEHIGDYAFADCRALAKVEMPKVKTIGEGAFTTLAEGGRAPRFTVLNLPETLTEIGDYAFESNTSLTTVIILGAIENIPEMAFAGCTSLTRVELPATVKTIEYGAFYGCQRLATINLGGVETFGIAAFRNTPLLTTVDLSAAKRVEDMAFGESGIAGDITADKLEYVGDEAFANSNAGSITAFTAPKLAHIGINAFANNTGLVEFVFSQDIEYVGYAAFNGCSALECFYYTDGDDKKYDGKINDYAELEDGVLYTHMQNGDLMLSSVPGGRALSTLMVKERTTVIERYAANANQSIKKIVLSDSLRSIGNFAFVDCTNLETVEFRSFTAPTLENDYVAPTDQYDTDHRLVEGDPGYDLVHSQYSYFNDTLCYYNFIDLAGKYEPINMILPANNGVVGYDSLVYELIFGKASDAEISNYVAMDENLSAFIVGAKEIVRIKTITLADETLVIDTISALEATSQKGTDYGYTADEWNTLVDTVYGAKQTIDAMKGVESTPTVEPTDDGGLAGWAIALIVIGCAIVVAAGVVVALILIKKRKGGNK